MSFDKSKLLVSKAPVEREVTFHDGTVAKLHFLTPTAADVRRWTEAEKAGGDELLYGMQRLVAASLYDPDKKTLVLTKDEWKGLTYAGCEALLPHVLEVAGVTKAKKSVTDASDSASS